MPLLCPFIKIEKYNNRLKVWVTHSASKWQSGNMPVFIPHFMVISTTAHLAHSVTGESILF